MFAIGTICHTPDLFEKRKYLPALLKEIWSMIVILFSMLLDLSAEVSEVGEEVGIAFGDVLGVANGDWLAAAEGGDAESLDQAVVGVGLDGDASANAAGLD